MGFKQELLKLPTYIETHLYFYLIDRFKQLRNGDDFKIYKSIDVKTPFGNTAEPSKDGISELKPDICVVNSEFALVAEAAAWDDDSKHASKQSESHQAMHQIGLSSDSVYFAQKIMCQLFPEYLYCKQQSKQVYSFISVTENHIPKMTNVINHLKMKGFIDCYVRPDPCDIRRYYQAIYEIKFSADAEKKINDIIIK